MCSKQYNDKMLDILNDRNTYEIISPQTITNSTIIFNKTYKKLIGNTDKTWLSLIDYHPIVPTIYGLPKTHKPGIPLRPIISGIGTAPHKIAKSLAKIITPLLGTVIKSHIKNCNSLI